MDSNRTLLFQHRLLKALLAFILRLQITSYNKHFEFPKPGNALSGQQHRRRHIDTVKSAHESTSTATSHSSGHLTTTLHLPSSRDNSTGSWSYKLASGPSSRARCALYGDHLTLSIRRLLDRKPFIGSQRLDLTKFGKSIKL